MGARGSLPTGEPDVFTPGVPRQIYEKEEDGVSISTQKPHTPRQTQTRLPTTPKTDQNAVLPEEEGDGDVSGTSRTPRPTQTRRLPLPIPKNDLKEGDTYTKPRTPPQNSIQKNEKIEELQVPLTPLQTNQEEEDDGVLKEQSGSNISKPDVISYQQKKIIKATYESLSKPLEPEEDDILKEIIRNSFGEDEYFKPWLFPKQLFNSEKWQTNDKYSTLEMTPQNKNGFPNVYDFVSHLWGRHATKKYNITKIVAIKNLNLQQIWERQLGNLDMRKRKANFQLNWNTFGHINNRQQVMNRLSKYIFKFENIYIMPVFHAPSPDAVESICESGFAIFGSTDDGFFGKGIYGTPQSDYAVRIYGRGVCVLCFVCFFNPFPVVSSDELLGAGNIGKADVHFVSVSPRSSHPEERNFFASAEDQEPVYDELVVFQESQIIPRYLIYHDMI